MAKKKVMNTVSTGLLVLLMLGLAGFGLTDFGGSVRTAATVGNAEITTNQFARAFDAQLNNFQRQTGQRLTPQQARAFGLERQTLAQLVAEAALQNEAMELGISVGDENVGREIQRTPGFQGLSGDFDRATYELALSQNGMTVSDFEARVRSDISEDLLRSAVAGGLATPDIFVDTLFNYARETRDVTWARLTESNLTEPVPAPTDAQLAEHHTANEAEFTRPETKSIRYAWLTPEAIAADLSVDETQLRALYDERIAEFQLPERRLVERLIFTTEEAATAAKARIDSGEATFEDLVADRGLSLESVDLGDATIEDLGEAGEAIFALSEPGVTDPLPSSLGPALYRMNGILAAQETSFEEARDELQTEAAADRARRIIIDTIPQVEDLLAGGADPALLAERTDMVEGSIEWNVDVFEGIAAYEGFRRLAAATVPGDFAEVVELDDGGIVTLTVDSVTPPELRPLEDVREEVIASWTVQATENALKEQAERLAQGYRDGREMATLGSALSFDRDARRDGFIEGTPPDFTQTLFEMEPGELRVLAADGDAWILRLDAINAADASDPEAQILKDAFAAQMAGDIGNAITGAYTQALIDETGVEVNQTAINAVLGGGSHGGM